MSRDCLPISTARTSARHSGNGQRVAYVTDADGNRIHLYASRASAPAAPADPDLAG